MIGVILAFVTDGQKLFRWRLSSLTGAAILPKH